MSANSLSLTYKMDLPFLTVSRENETDFYITNNSNDPIVFDNDNQIAVKDMPRFSSSDYVPASGFYVYFYYGDDAGHITTVADSGNIVFSMKSTDTWDIFKDTDYRVGVYWIICPKKTISLGAHQNIVIRVSNIKCNSATGFPAVEIQLRNGFDKNLMEYTDLQKIDMPVITSFAPAVSDYEIGQDVDFKWTAERTDKCETILDGVKIPTGNVARLNMHDKPYVLSITNRAGHDATSTYIPKFTFIEQFDYVFETEGRIHLRWKTRSMQNHFISGIGIVPPSGDRDYSVTGDVAITLSGTQVYSPEITHKSTIRFLMPVITKFTAKKTNTYLEENGAAGFITMEEIAAKQTIPVLLPPYAVPPVPPPSIYVAVEWQTQNASNCYFTDRVSTYPPSGKETIAFSIGIKTIVLTAKAPCGYPVTKSCTI